MRPTKTDPQEDLIEHFGDLVAQQADLLLLAEMVAMTLLRLFEHLAFFLHHARQGLLKGGNVSRGELPSFLQEPADPVHKGLRDVVGEFQQTGHNRGDEPERSGYFSKTISHDGLLVWSLGSVVFTSRIHSGS